MTSNSDTFQISKWTYDQSFETILGISVVGIVLAALWIVSILVQIEANKVNFYGSNTSHSLEMEEECSVTSSHVDDSASVASSSMRSVHSQGTMGGGGGGGPSSPPHKASSAPTRTRRVKMSFKLLQLASVSALLLLTYLLLVVTEAPKWASALGSLCVFGVFLRFQIGDELRRQRIDRIILMMSLFLFIASLMSLCTYSFKSLENGEIYQGPARIVGYMPEQYNNSVDDPNTRMDLAVQWGKAWGCPKSGGKVCQTQVQGAMCTVNTENGLYRKRRFLEQRRQQQQQSQANEESGANQEEETTEVEDEETLKQENEELEKENEELQKEVEELELENEKTKEVAEEEVEEAEEEEEEVADLYDEEMDEMEEEELEVEEAYTDAYLEVEEEEEELKEENETDADAAAEDEEVKEELEEEKVELDEVFEDYEGEYKGYAKEDEEYYEDALEEEEALQEDEEIAEEEYDAAITEVAEGKTSEQQDEELQEEAMDTIEKAVEEGEDNGDQEEEWYWDEVTYEYDDDYYESVYWDYDWDSVWGEYACEDLFDEDASRVNYDLSTPAGQDGYPYINIYGSCKTCEAYILDYFAVEAFESVEEHKRMAFAYMTGALAGFIFSFLAFIKYKVRPPADNEIELLDTNCGVMA